MLRGTTCNAGAWVSESWPNKNPLSRNRAAELFLRKIRVHTDRKQASNMVNGTLVYRQYRSRIQTSPVSSPAFGRNLQAKSQQLPPEGGTTSEK